MKNLLSVLVLSLFGFGVAIAAPPGSVYEMGETIDPSCAQGSLNCETRAPAASGANSDITSLDAIDEFWLGASESAAQNAYKHGEMRFNVETTSTSTATNWEPQSFFDMYVEPTANLGSGAHRTSLAAYGIVPNTNIHTLDQVQGVSVGAENYGTGTITGALYGAVDWAYNAANATVNLVGGHWSGAQSDQGTVTHVYSSDLWSGIYGGTVADNRAINIYMENAGGTVTDRYGVYIGSFVGSATNDYGIYQAGSSQDNYFAGNVGIGTPSPSELLVLQGDGDADIDLFTYENAGTDNSSLHFHFANGTSAAPGLVIDDETVAQIDGLAWDGATFQDIARITMVTDATTGANDTPGAIKFFNTPDDSTTLLERMTIDEEGEVGINPSGHTVGNEELYIGPSEDALGSLSSDTAISMDNNGHVYEIHVENDDTFIIYENENEDHTQSVLEYDGTNNHIGFSGAEAVPGVFWNVDNGATLSNGGTWTDASSRALKQDIKSLSTSAAYGILSGLDPVSYAYKAEPDDQRLGFIAEDVPDEVATPSRTGLAPMDIVAVLTKVIQDQDERIKALEAQLQ